MEELIKITDILFLQLPFIDKGFLSLTANGKTYDHNLETGNDYVQKILRRNTND